MSAFRELRYWSDSHGCDCLRLSHVGEDLHERWVIIELNIGSEERHRRERLAEQRLLDAERTGAPPGELPISFE